MFHIYVNTTKLGYRYMVIDEVSLSFDYMNTLDEKYIPNNFRNFAPSFSEFTEYLDKREYFFDTYTFSTAVPSLHELPSIYPELFI